MKLRKIADRLDARSQSCGLASAEVNGVTPIQPGVSLTWSAQLNGSGTCNA